MAHESTASVILHVDVAPPGASLRIRFHVTNDQSSPVYLFNVLWEHAGKGTYIEARMPVYASLRSPGVLCLLKGLAPLPKAREVEVRNVPFATRVDPGQVFAEEIDMRLPIDEYSPYFSPPSGGTVRTVQAREIVFALDFIRAHGDETVRKAPLDQAVWIHHPRLLERIQRIERVIASLPIDVNKSDEFEAF